MVCAISHYVKATRLKRKQQAERNVPLPQRLLLMTAVVWLQSCTNFKIRITEGKWKGK